MSKFTPKLCEMILHSIRDFNKSEGISSERFKTVDLNGLCNIIFERVLNLLIFGQIEMEPTSSGKSVYHTIVENFEMAAGIRRNPLYVLYPGLVSKFKLSKQYKLASDTNEVLLGYVKKWYAKRVSEGNLGDCVFDRLIAHNQQCQKENNLQDYVEFQQLVGTINIMVFTGTDTTQNTTKMIICKMANRADLKQMFDEVNQQLLDASGSTTSDKLDENEILGLWLKETLRLYHPGDRVVPRIAKRDLVLKDLHIRKGDAVSVLFSGLTVPHTICVFWTSLK